MPHEYTSIKEDVLEKLSQHLPELGIRFSVETIGVFGSVSRGEDTAESDIDIFYAFREGSGAGMFTCMELVSYLEDLFGRRVDLVSLNGMKPYFRVLIEPEMIPAEAVV